MKVFLVATHFIQYGLELAGGLVLEGAKVRIAFCPGHAERLIGPRWRELVADGVEICELPRPPRRKILSLATMRNTLKLWRGIRNFRPDVVHLQSSIDPAVALTGLFSRRPVVATVHDVTPHLGEEKKLNPFLDFLEYRIVLPWIRRRGVRFIVHGESLRGELAERMGVPLERVTKVPHGVFSGYTLLDSGEEVPAPGPTVLFFGRMEPYKGVGVLADAIPLVRARIPDVRFLLAGRGEALDQLRPRLDAEAGVEIQDHYIETEDVGLLFRQATVVAAPYLEASQSGVIGIALAFGVPVVATDVGALSEMVEDGNNGLLVGPDQPSVFAEALCRVLEDPELASLLGSGARESAEGPFSWKTAARMTLDWYRGEAGSGPQGRS